jgi:hypothetical protein
MFHTGIVLPETRSLIVGINGRNVLDESIEEIEGGRYKHP